MTDTTTALPVTSINTAFEKYASAIFAFFTVVTTILITAGSGAVTAISLGQVITQIAAAVILYIVPLVVNGKWQGALKTGFQILSTLIVLALPFIFAHHITTMQLLVVIVAATQAVASEFGIQIRKNGLALAA